MAGFRRMDEKRRRAGRSQRCRDFLADVSGFSHSGDDDASFDGLHHVERLGQVFVKFAFHDAKGVDFLVNGSARRFDIGV